MKQNKFGELIFNENDVCDFVMQGHDIENFTNMIVDNSVDLEKILSVVQNYKSLLSWRIDLDRDQSVEKFHAQQQSNWHMPDEYKTLDIAEHVLSLCSTQEELQRCGAELLLYQERDLFNLLRYLKYLVDTMSTNKIIWGVGRGSSVSSYVLYKLRVHRIDSLYYNLDIAEFLR